MMIIRKAATISRIEGKQAVLLLENGQELSMLREEFGGAAVPGAAFVVTVMAEADAALERDDLAKAVVNRILNEGSQAGQAGA